jgi:GH15 family glucan-1,4-alpha-glucosidase
MTSVPERYKPIADYGAIGNLRSVALVGKDGAIDWCCLPDMDEPSVFAAILDADKGGVFRVSPVNGRPGEQRYVPGTNVLQTIFSTTGGQLTVTDFFPLWGDLEGCGGSETRPEIHRVLEFEGSSCEVDVAWQPRFDYGRTVPQVRRVAGGFMADGGTFGRMALSDAGGRLEVDEEGTGVRGVLRFEGPGKQVLVTQFGGLRPYGLDASLGLREETEAAWRRWSYKESANGERAWAGGWKEEVLRSELALKLMTYADTGAIAAAPTTSLPETIGGVRNWDYRFCWIRDAAMTGRAFMAMGHDREMVEFVHWADRASRARAEKKQSLQIMYGLRGEREGTVQELTHLEGYLKSAPVRVGNLGFEQDQPDIFGELMDASEQLVSSGHDLPGDIAEFLPLVADAASTAWRRPDNGLWEAPKEPMHYVHSKAMVWVALDRAVKMAEGGVIQGDVARWKANRDALQRLILERGYNKEIGAFTQTLGGTELDAATLLLPLEGVIGFDDPRVQSTINCLLERLTNDDLVYRYLADDGLPGEEGGFVLCTFWMVDALALSGRQEEAERMFARLVERSNHLGLLSEQIDPYTHALLGNFPQAFSHIGLINSALYLSRPGNEGAPGANGGGGGASPRVAF